MPVRGRPEIRRSARRLKAPLAGPFTHKKASAITACQPGIRAGFRDILVRKLAQISTGIY